MLGEWSGGEGYRFQPLMFIYPPTVDLVSKHVYSGAIYVNRTGGRAGGLSVG